MSMGEMSYTRVADVEWISLHDFAIIDLEKFHAIYNPRLAPSQVYSVNSK